MQWFDALEAPIGKDLEAFSHYLSLNSIAHRIIERDGHQVLLLIDPGEIERVRGLFNAWEDGSLVAGPPRAPRVFDWRSGLSAVARFPVVTLLALLGIGGWLVVWLDSYALMSQLIFQDAFVDDRGNLMMRPASDRLVGGEWWRLFTPMFLHFGIIHLVFNLLWLVEFGRRIEQRQSSVRLLLVVFASGAIANLCQFAYSPGGVFGGLSGAVYGLLGYCWLWDKLRPAQPLELQKGVAIFLVGWMLLGMTGVFSALGIIHIANAAHLGGFVSGLLLAPLFAWKAGARRDE